jgi:hypothetical protein
MKTKLNRLILWSILFRCFLKKINFPLPKYFEKAEKMISINLLKIILIWITIRDFYPNILNEK